VDWWQILLLILAFAIIGVFLGVSVSYLILKFQKRDVTFLSALTFRPARRYKSMPIREWRSFSETSTSEESLAEKPAPAPVEEKPVIAPTAPSPVAEAPKAPAPTWTPPAAQETPDLAVSSLFVEVKHNYEVATQPPGDKLSPLETSVWDKHFYEIEKLPPNVREDLEQVYIDIRLVNSLVWLSNEFGRRTPELERNYTRLCNNIIGRLDRIVQSLELRLASK